MECFTLYLVNQQQVVAFEYIYEYICVEEVKILCPPSFQIRIPLPDDYKPLSMNFYSH